MFVVSPLVAQIIFTDISSINERLQGQQPQPLGTLVFIVIQISIAGTTACF